MNVLRLPHIQIFTSGSTLVCFVWSTFLNCIAVCCWDTFGMIDYCYCCFAVSFVYVFALFVWSFRRPDLMTSRSLAPHTDKLLRSCSKSSIVRRVRTYDHTPPGTSFFPARRDARPGIVAHLQAQIAPDPPNDQHFAGATVGHRPLGDLDQHREQCFLERKTQILGRALPVAHLRPRDVFDERQDTWGITGQGTAC